MALDGRDVVFAHLAQELAQQASVRTRYIADMVALDALARDLGPLGVRLMPASNWGRGSSGTGASDGGPCSLPPWRVRAEPRGERVDRWLERCSPVTMHELMTWLKPLLDIVGAVHERGRVLRAIDAHRIYLDGTQVSLVDVGFTRADLLSTRTAASLVLQSSPYAAPEQLRTAVVDQRADVFALGVLAYRALTGVLPFGEGAALVPEGARAPHPELQGVEVAPAAWAVLEAATSPRVADRPATVTAFIEGLRATPSQALATGAQREQQACQHCGAQLPEALRLCIYCGRMAVSFEHCPAGEGVALALTSASEDAAFLDRLERMLDTLGHGRPQSLNFLLGSETDYSETERKERIRLPLRLLDDLDRAQAQTLAERFEAEGISVAVVERKTSDTSLSRVQKSGMAGLVGVGAAVSVLLGLSLGQVPALVALASLLVIMVVAWVSMASFNHRRSLVPLMRLRPKSVALPASDPLLAEMAQAFESAQSPDLRTQLTAMALDIQLLVDHRSAHLGASDDIDRVTAPVAALVELIVGIVRDVAEIDAQRAGIDESAILRELPHVSGAREAELLAALQRAESLLDRRARAFHQLLAAGESIHRSRALALEIVDEQSEHAREVERAFQALSSGGS